MVLGIGATSALGVVLVARGHDLLWLFLGLPFAAMLLVALRYAPTGYRLAPDGVHVERRAGPKVIPYATIRHVDREVRRWSGLTATGSNGLFGRFGWFWNLNLGLYRLYITNRVDLVWLLTTQGWVGLSPERPDDFVAALGARLGTTR